MKDNIYFLIFWSSDLTGSIGLCGTAYRLDGIAMALDFYFPDYSPYALTITAVEFPLEVKNHD